jgi:hypothetical protein
MHKTLELVIFDYNNDRDAAEYSREAAKRLGLELGVFSDPEKASAAAGLYTLGIITAIDRNHRSSSGILTPLDVSRLLEIPRAVILDDQMRPEEFIRPGFKDTAVHRDAGIQIRNLVGTWLQSLNS